MIQALPSIIHLAKDQPSPNLWFGQPRWKEKEGFSAKEGCFSKEISSCRLNIGLTHDGLHRFEFERKETVLQKVTASRLVL